MASIIGTALVTYGLTHEISLSGSLHSSTMAAAPDGAGADRLKPEELDKINAVLGLIETKYYKDVDRDEIIDGAVKGMMSALEDPYSVYMEKDVAQHFSESVEGSFTGIGAEVTMDSGNVVIVSPIKSSPAEKAGLLAKDIVLSVNGKKLSGLDLNEAVSLIRGPKGTKAKLLIKRTGHAEPLELDLIRDDIDVETVFAKKRDDGVGVIEIRQFSLNTADRFAEELAKLEQQGISGLVIDVRNNPGGILPVVIKVAENFVPKGKTIVQVEDRGGNREKTLSGGQDGKSYPIAVLMNKGSASASEILAGALHEEADAILVGETSYGKGTVQVSYNKALGDGSLIKMTIAKWLTPNGEWIHQKGIEPDVKAPAPALYSAARLSVTKPLVADSIGDQVRSLQTILKGLGYDPKRDDGYYSTSTVQAVKQFQSHAGLPADGKVDAKTANALEQAAMQWLKQETNDSQLQQAVEAVKGEGRK
ncbi:PDZ domain-containing protein [Paenibacillus protaetiae]|uniref:PDZ domain-containing protein n=2 Tax=Paenibacillus protaetiae TaxID=2509456 RepID=A0A4V0YFR0_9BACL|nr:PDZ domain-containing protein [Paenibacillus protaetiae]